MDCRCPQRKSGRHLTWCRLHYTDAAMCEPGCRCYDCRHGGEELRGDERFDMARDRELMESE